MYPIENVFMVDVQEVLDVSCQGCKRDPAGSLACSVLLGVLTPL